MSLMLSGYIITAADLFAYASASSIPFDGMDADSTELVTSVNAWLLTQDGLPLLRRIQPQNAIILPTRAITVPRFKFAEEDGDEDLKRIFLAHCLNGNLKQGLQRRMKFVTVPNPHGHTAPPLPPPETCDAPSDSNTKGRKRSRSEI